MNLKRLTGKRVYNLLVILERDILTNNLLYYRKFIDNFTDYYRIIDELFIGINKIVYFKSEDPFNLS